MVDVTKEFNDSFERISIHSDSFYDTFYRCFTGKSAEIALLFVNLDMDNQKKMLKKSLSFMVAFAATNHASDYMVKLSDLHQNKLNIPDQMYVVWMDSLIETLWQLDPLFSKDSEQGWREMFAPGIQFMQKGQV
jgi:hypothetical protein